MSEKNKKVNIIRDKDRISEIQKSMIRRRFESPSLGLRSAVREVKRDGETDISSRKNPGLEFLNRNKVGFNEGDIRKQIRDVLREINYQNQALGLKNRALNQFQRNYITRELVRPFKRRIYEMAGIHTPDTFPKDKFLAFHKEAAENRGHGREFQQLPNNAVEIQIRIQKESLDRWLEYFASKDSDVFPSWIKYWALMGVIKMSSQQNRAEGATFPKRERDTFNDFPQLNPGALALCLDHIRSTVLKTGDKPDEALESQSFQKIYTHYYNKVLSEKSAELLITGGEWVRYPKGSNPQELVRSIKGKGTSWCTEGYETAKTHLQGGDFDVYYSYDKHGKPTNPRIAVRWERDSIAEMRGIGTNQNLDPQISASDVPRRRLEEYGEAGKVYLIREENMRRLTKIHRAFKRDISYEISEEDIDFVNSRPEGFSQGTEDPRIQEILSVIELREKYNLPELDEETIKQIISENYGQKLCEIIQFIKPNLHLLIANMLIDAGLARAVAQNLEKFSGLEAAIAIKLIDAGEGRAVAQNLEKFSGLDASVANKLIDAGQGWVVAKYLEKFSNLNHIDIADRLIGAGQEWAVAKYLEKFSNLNHNDIANRLIERGQGQAVADNLEKFSNLNHIDIADRLIGAGKGWAVADNLEKFSNLNHIDIANRIIDAGQGRAVAEYLEKFSNLNHIDIADRLIGAGQGWAVVENLEKFSGLDASVANKLIDAGKGWSVAKYLEKFSNLNHIDIADRLIGAGQGWSVAKYLEKFSGLDAAIANRLIDAGQGEYVARYLEKFSNLNHNDIADKLIGAGEGRAVAENLEKFSGLNIMTAVKLCRDGTGLETLKQYPQSFSFDINQKVIMMLLRTLIYLGFK